ncbi:hemerythrin domain-containing protein [Stigmatella aurantiaca]|uniref:Cation-binding protein, hemerythrin HHE family n=1 Tax=Stigmatella aurantiaca (strain DW4/3-1) TaxID=378806 RepID=Q09CX5_STIAD|nr:hemerythrin domain-containing protein [Stigmatella aurantiaca]ADO70133.1 Cation-binding protein, hemerythrin HHE family [Stigmatella aurantiaca DW4/3-1]EAU69580.1 hemerythrin HHE cation binding region [Stigmatella aurantiaca DW4/3-1]
MNAIDLLEDQHQEVKKLFKKYESLGDGADAERRELFEKIADRLAAHTSIEELYFYPSVKAARTEEQLYEAVEEHLAAKRIIADLLQMKPDSEYFDAKMKVLQESIDHHVEEEEEELFPKVRKLLTEEQLLVLGIQMKEEFDEIMEAEPRYEVPMQTDVAAPI